MRGLILDVCVKVNEKKESSNFFTIIQVTNAEIEKMEKTDKLLYTIFKNSFCNGTLMFSAEGIKKKGLPLNNIDVIYCPSGIGNSENIIKKLDNIITPQMHINKITRDEAVSSHRVQRLKELAVSITIFALFFIVAVVASNKLIKYQLLVKENDLNIIKNIGFDKKRLKAIIITSYYSISVFACLISYPRR
ncbi:MAG: hypothetical protein VZR23_06995 [Lachnospiraceae bacterium]|nr:hypothetical protein [Lachnospiraceae bacterium]